jgi:hypothetical protein
MRPKVPWVIRAIYLDSCNCDWGCPGQFGARPTHGNCEGSSVFHILKGRYGVVGLDRSNVASAYPWPGAVHEGQGKASFYVDDRSSPEQFDAISRILTGAAGGGPFAVYASTLDRFQAPRRAKIGFQAKSIRSRATIEGVGVLELEPMRSPVSGKVQRAIIELPGGFEFPKTEVTSLKEMVVADGYMGFHYSGTYGSFPETHWRGP